MRLNHTVQALIKGSRGEITSPVVVFTVCVGKEISTENRIVSWSGSLSHPIHFVNSIEVVGESPKLSLEEPHDVIIREGEKKKKETLTQSTAERKK